MPSTTDRIEKEIILDAPRARVWRAITNVREFNEWFGVALTAPFAPGVTVSGQITHPGYEHVTMTAWVETMEPEHHFAYRWHPDNLDPTVDYSAEPTTLVTFILEEVERGTRLIVTETGFDALPASRRAHALQGNSNGWKSQLERI
ncbi:MAG: SRPBCC family protein, partial [bacterium]